MSFMQDVLSRNKMIWDECADTPFVRGELTDDTPVDALANALTDVIYGEMLCWDMSGGAYSFEERTKEFCRLLLPAMIRPYIREE